MITKTANRFTRYIGHVSGNTLRKAKKAGVKDTHNLEVKKSQARFLTTAGGLGAGAIGTEAYGVKQMLNRRKQRKQLQTNRNFQQPMHYQGR